MEGLIGLLNINESFSFELLHIDFISLSRLPSPRYFVVPPQAQTKIMGRT